MLSNSISINSKTNFTMQPLDCPINLNWYGKTILIVDNNFISAFLLKEYFSVTSLKLIHHTYNEVLNIKIDERIDLIINGINLIEMKTGLGMTAIIKKKYPGIPLIAYSSSVHDYEIKACYNAGCNDFIEKPVDFDYLDELLAKYL